MTTYKATFLTRFTGKQNKERIQGLAFLQHAPRFLTLKSVHLVHTLYSRVLYAS